MTSVNCGGRLHPRKGTADGSMAIAFDSSKNNLSESPRP